jgi:hypothetical protein
MPAEEMGFGEFNVEDLFPNFSSQLLGGPEGSQGGNAQQVGGHVQLAHSGLWPATAQHGNGVVLVPREANWGWPVQAWLT